VIELASKEANLDAAKLRDKAIDVMRNESVAAHGNDLDHSGDLRGHKVDAA